MKRFLLLGIVGTFASLNAFSQKATVNRFTAPLAGTVNLSEVDDKYNAEVFSVEMPDPDAEVEQRKLQLIKKKVAEQFPRKSKQLQYKVTTAPMPTIALTYLADSSAGTPPDNDMAVSNGAKSVSVINSSVALHNANTGQMTARKSLKTLSNSVGLNSFLYDYRYDPKIIYDPNADRFICVMLNGTDAHNYIVLGFSSTNDPAGTWSFYKFYGNYGGDTTWFDYPSIAITADEFFLTGNKIKYSTSWQAGFRQTVIYQIRKQDGYNGSANLNYQIWENVGYNGVNIRNLYPVKGGGSIYGPEQYFLSNRNFDVQNDTIFLIKIPDTIGSLNNNITVTPLKSNLQYGVPPDGRQKDTFTLATNDGRILGAYRQGNEIQFVSTSVHPANGSAAVYHGKISNITSAPAMQASYFTIDTLDFGYPNVSYAGNYNGVNHSIISFNYTGPNENAGIGAIYYDGTQFSDLLKVKTGDSSIEVMSGKQQRWGDYMGSQPDWTNIGMVWVEGIFGTKKQNYGNWIAKLVSPFYTGINDAGHSTESATLYPNPAFQYIKLDFELSRESVITFSLYNLEGKKVDELLRRRCEAGKNIIQFNTASLPAGIYFLKGNDERNKQVMSKRFVKQ